jgi:site-specific DNA-methyltransferase (adenine-specific)
MEINKIYNENCLDTMAKMPDCFVDLTVTSPPYDNLRDYNGYTFDFEGIAKELYRITKEGGVVVWVVGDATIKGSETGTSFKQALYFIQLGFNLHDTMIYSKSGFKNPSNDRYHQTFEYMFVFSKGKPKTFNPIKDRKNKYVGVHGGEKSFRDEYGKRFNVWYYANGGNNTTKDAVFKHPAIFPEQLANDHIISWSNEGDLVYDPFMGSGTTAKMSILNSRNWIGSEISEEYCKIIETRIKECGGLFFNSFQTELSNVAGT